MSSRAWTTWTVRTAVAVAAPVLILACSGGGGVVTAPPPPPPSAVASVTVSPGTASVTSGGTTQLTATPRDAGGTALTGRTVTWSSSNTAIASVSPQGLVTGVAAGGPVTITATSEGINGTAAITVSNAPVATVVVTPTPAAVTVGATAQLIATLKDANNIVLGGRTISWTSSNNSVATVSATGLVTGVAVGGPVTITATSEGISGTASVNVSATPVATVTVTPTPTSVNAGATTQLTAIVKDAGNNVLNGRAVTWNSSNTALATVSTTGLVTGVAAGGPVTITATSEGINGTASVTVNPVPVATVGVAPGATPLNTGATVQLTATTRDAAGNTLVGRTIVWTSSATTIATVSTTGLVTAVGAGNATITATSEGHAGNATVTVTDGGTIGLAGGTITAAGGAVKLVFQTNTVANGTAVTVSVPATPPAPLAGQVLTNVPGSTYTFGPDGTPFAKTVALTIHYDVAQLPAGALEADLAIYTYASGVWTPESGSTVDLVNKTVTAPIAHFSTWGVLASTISAAGYTLTDLGTLPGAQYSSATGVNNNGDVVGGSSNDAAVLGTPFRYHTGVMTALPLLAGAGPNYAAAINNSGQVSGVINGSAVRWDGGTTIVALNGSGGTAINASGVVAGGANGGGGTQPATLTASGPTFYTPLAGYTAGIITAINDAGATAGMSTGPGPETAVRYSSGGSVDLGVGPFSFVTGMNNAGQIVGYSNNNSRAYVYSSGVVTFLPVPTGTSSSIARSINNAGQIVGEVSIGAWGRAVLFSNGGIIDLNTLIAPSQFVMISAYGINDNGQIVGYGVTSKADLLAGHPTVQHAFLLTPK